jgi:hypothetical protein
LLALAELDQEETFRLEDEALVRVRLATLGDDLDERAHRSLQQLSRRVATVDAVGLAAPTTQMVLSGRRQLQPVSPAAAHTPGIAAGARAGDCESEIGGADDNADGVVFVRVSRSVVAARHAGLQTPQPVAFSDIDTAQPPVPLTAAAPAPAPAPARNARTRDGAVRAPPPPPPLPPLLRVPVYADALSLALQRELLLEKRNISGLARAKVTERALDARVLARGRGRGARGELAAPAGSLLTDGTLAVESGSRERK